MHYVYVLQSKRDKEFYIGCTKNLKVRVSQHNANKVVATRERTPFRLIHYEAYLNKTDAFAREQWLKSGYGRRHLNKSLGNFLKSLGA